MKKVKQFPCVKGAARLILASALIFTATMLTGCATMVNGTHQRIAVDSIPSGAQVVVDDKEVGKTPTSINVWRGDSHRVTLRKEGYVEQTIHTFQSFSPWYMGNILFGVPGLVGMVIDMSSGATYKLDPESIQVTLTEAPDGVLSSGPSPVLQTPRPWSAARKEDSEVIAQEESSAQSHPLPVWLAHEVPVEEDTGLISEEETLSQSRPLPPWSVHEAPAGEDQPDDNREKNQSSN